MSKIKQGLIHLLVILLVLPGAISTQLFHLAIAHAGQAPDVVINEVMWMGSTASPADEWLELRNTTANPIDMSNWRLTNAATSGTDLVLPSFPAPIIPANGYYLISNFSDASASSILNVAPDDVTTSVSLGNTCASIVLEKSDLTVVDTMGCNGSSYFAGSNSSVKRSLERNVDVTDGTVASSWHDSVGFANLDLTAAPNNFASPKIVNDATAPSSVAAVVRDSAGSDVDFTVNAVSLTANWSGFSDSESSLSYQVGVGTAAGLTNIVDWTAETLTSHTFAIPTPPGWSENQTFYVAVKAVNIVGLESAVVSSDGITLNTVDPNAPTNLIVSDVPHDQGGSLQASWSPSTSLDVTSYQLNYRSSGGSWVNQNVGLVTTKIINGLANAPTTYEFTVEAIDFNDQHSLPTAIVTGQAQDNTGLTLDSNKIHLTQNQAGHDDVVFGEAGAASQIDATVTVYDRDPAQTSAQVIGSTLVNSDGSFATVSIGDNRYSAVWVRVSNINDNTSPVVSLINDIAGPNSPTLESLTSHCRSNSCRVQLSWHDNGPDSQKYQLIYRSSGAMVRSFDLTSSSVALDVSPNRNYDFTIVAMDQFSNPSGESNVFSARLLANQSLTIKLKNGRPVTTITSSIQTTSPVNQVAVQSKTATLVPVAEAAEPVSTITPGPAEATSATSQDWVRIFVVIVLLLIVAGSFYALSRSFREEKEELVIAKTKTRAKTAASKSKTSASKKKIIATKKPPTTDRGRRRSRRR